jgi:hypothetical protein
MYGMVKVGIIGNFRTEMDGSFRIFLEVTTDVHKSLEVANFLSKTESPHIHEKNLDSYFIHATVILPSTPLGKEHAAPFATTGYCRGTFMVVQVTVFPGHFVVGESLRFCPRPCWLISFWFFF